MPVNIQNTPVNIQTVLALYSVRLPQQESDKIFKQVGEEEAGAAVEAATQHASWQHSVIQVSANVCIIVGYRDSG